MAIAVTIHTSNQTVDAGAVVTLDATISGWDTGDTFSWLEDGFSLPTEGTFSNLAGGILNADSADGTWTAPSPAVQTTYVLSLTAEGASDSVSITVRAGSVTAPGVPTGVSLTQISGDSDSLRATWNAVTGATSYQGQYKKTSDPSWTPISGNITSPHQINGLDPNTSHDFRVRATNSGGSSNYSSADSATTDAVTDLMPTAPNISNQSATVGTPYSQTLAAGSGGDTPLSYTASPLPAGLSFNTSTRVISGTPTSAGSTTVTYTVTDDDGDSDTDTFVITVAAAPVTPDPIGWSSPTRLDSIADLDTIFDRADTGSSGGAWTLDTAGSTTSGNTGPGTNSGAPYVYSETSSGSFSTIPVKSTLTVKPTVMTAWTGADRQMLLRAAIQGAFSATEGLEVEGRALDSDDWTRIELLEGWAYSNSYASGGTVTDAAGDTQTFSQVGGWIDFAVTIPDAYTQVRIHTLAISGGNFYEHDIALWRIELLDGTAAVTPPGAPTNLNGSGDEDSRSLSWSEPGDNGGSPITGYRIFRADPANIRPYGATQGPQLPATQTAKTLRQQGITTTWCKPSMRRGLARAATLPPSAYK